MSKSRLGMRRAGVALAVLASMTWGTPAPLRAQAGAIIPVDLPVGRSYPLRTDVPVTRVSIANPEVADVVVISEREVVINAIKPGETDAIIWLQGDLRQHYRIVVRDAADRRQIAIAVKFAEVRRDALREIGVSGLYRDKNVRVGTGLFNTDSPIDRATGDISLPPTSKVLTVLSDLGTDKILAFLDAQETRGNAQLLAEPTILAANRQEASFLAGGELPIPVVQGGQAGGGNTAVTVQYREFGIRLRFLGDIVTDSLIRLTLTPEVSSLDYGNAIIIQGFRVPALRTRRVSSTIDVRQNESLIISGLMNGEEERVKTGIPFLKDIPILGQLFSSTRFQRNESELLVIVTPVVVDPMRPRPQDTLRMVPDTTKPALDALKKRLPSPEKKP